MENNIKKELKGLSGPKIEETKPINLTPKQNEKPKPKTKPSRDEKIII